MDTEQRELLKAQICQMIDQMPGDFTVIVLPHQKDAVIRSWVNGQEQKAPIDTPEHNIAMAVRDFTSAIVKRDPEPTLDKLRAIGGPSERVRETKRFSESIDLKLTIRLNERQYQDSLRHIKTIWEATRNCADTEIELHNEDELLARPHGFIPGGATIRATASNTSGAVAIASFIGAIARDK